MLQDRSAFTIAVEALLAVQQQAIDANSVAGGQHLCFMGSGRDEEDQYVHMVVAWFLQNQHKFVSLADGGYDALHRMVSRTDSEKFLTDHNKRKCLSCISPANKSGLAIPESVGNSGLSSASDSAGNSDTESTSSSSIFDKMSKVVKSKSMEMKGKFVDYINNPSNSGVVEGRHVSSSDKLGKRYLPKSTSSQFRASEDVDSEGSDESSQELNVEQWAKDQRSLGLFRCQEIKEDGYMFPR